MSKNQAVARVRPKAAPGDQSRAAAHNPGVLRLPGLPVSWQRTALGEVLQAIIGGGTPSKSKPEYFQGHIPLMTVKDMRERRPSGTGFRITEEALQNSSAKLVPADTLIIATRMGLGKVVRAPFETAINQDLKALFPADGIEKSFLEYWLVSIAGKLEGMGTGTTVKGLRLEQVKSLEFPVAPLNEQRRIVEKIETLFARIDKGEEALREVRKLLKRYRQSILKAAVTGELTRDWREANKDKLEPASELLARILKTRRENWQGRGKYKEPAALDTTDLPELPEGWTWSSAGQLCECIVPNRDKPKSFSGDIPWITIPDLDDDGYSVYESREKIGLSEDEVKKCRARIVPSGSVIMTCIGRFGISAVCEQDMVINQQLHAFLIPEGQFDAEYLAFALQAQKKRMERVATSTTIAYLNKSNCNSTPVPVPSLEEQLEIAQRMKNKLEDIQRLTQTCDAELTRSSALRQSILKSAFTGKLVPQDPDDEPASKLLSRIQA